ncbi:protein-tyrosine phosphatase-like protein, partial [Phaeosphaeriaceae sp. PMI808]
QTLHSLKITHILSLGAAPSTPTTLGLAHKVISINDNPYEDLLRELDDACEFISGALDRNGKDGEEENNVLVHCHQGISRSASVVIAYMMRVLRMSYEDALAAVVEVRPIVAPNEGFARQL